MGKPRGAIKVDSTNVFDGLTDKERMFCIEYATDLNGVRAATEAGYAIPSLMASRLMKKEKILKVIDYLLKPALEEAKLTKERVVKQLENMTFANLIPFLDDEGFLNCHPRDLPESIQQAIVSIETDKRYDREGNVIGEKRKIKLVDKLAAVDMSLKFLGEYKTPTSNTNINVGVGVIDWESFHAAKERVQSGETLNIVENRLAELEKLPNAKQ